MASEVPPVELYREVAFPRRSIYERIIDGEDVNIVQEFVESDAGWELHSVTNEGVTNYIRDLAKSGVLIDAASVRDYARSTLTEFPNPMPPAPPIFDVMFIEFVGYNEATIVESVHDEDGWHAYLTMISSLGHRDSGERPLIIEDACDFRLNEDGSVESFYLGCDLRGELENDPFERDRIPPAFRLKMIERANEFLLAMAFASCRNVRLVDRPDTRTRQQRRDDERKGRDLVTFKVLEIGGVTDVYDGPAAKNANPSKRSLHICRGHFSEYTKDKPLFGKYSGRFWIPAHTRGTMDKGRVIKDYRILPPVEANA